MRDLFGTAGTWGTVCARVANRALLGGPSTSLLDL
jgi:hypothetical protein